jgi:hypothetical protein
VKRRKQVPLSKESAEALARGIADAKAGRIFPVPRKWILKPKGTKTK